MEIDLVIVHFLMLNMILVYISCTTHSITPAVRDRGRNVLKISFQDFHNVFMSYPSAMQYGHLDI